MKNSALSLFSIFILASCFQSNPQRTSQVDDFQQPENTTTPSYPNLLAECDANVECRGHMEALFQQWAQNQLDDTAVAEESQAESNPTENRPEEFTQFNLTHNELKNELVKGALNEWLTWKRPQLINTWNYYQFLKADIKPEFDKYGIEESFVVAIMAQESGGKVHSNSRAGAGGLFQLMPYTAKRLGLSGKKGSYDLRYDPKSSAQAAALYIQEQIQAYDGDKAKILAAYNSGENRMARLNKAHKNAPVWDKNFYYDLPRETRHYIPAVIAAMLIFDTPENFNVKLNDTNTELMTVQLNHVSSLSELAVCVGQEQNEMGWFRVIRNLNSGITADKEIPAQTELLLPKILEQAFNTHCQNQQLMAFAQSIHKADFSNKNTLFKYRVKQGDSLSRIARKFSCTSKREIAKLNNLKAPKYLIRAGKYLKIPQC